MYGIRAWEEGHSLRIQFKKAFLFFQGFTQSLPFPLPQPPFGIQNDVFCPWAIKYANSLGFIYLSIYLSGFGRKTSSQNVISEQEKCQKELEELKLEIQKCKFERDELYQILDLYIYDDWDLSIRHSQLLREQAQLKNKIQILLNEKREQLVEQTELPASSVEAKRLCEEAGMNICVPSAKQQQPLLPALLQVPALITAQSVFHG
nr:uncharacterized protein LOC120094604 isoform X5 [Rattus norvegicus]